MRTSIPAFVAILFLSGCWAAVPPGGVPSEAVLADDDDSDDSGDDLPANDDDAIDEPDPASPGDSDDDPSDDDAIDLPDGPFSDDDDATDEPDPPADDDDGDASDDDDSTDLPSDDDDATDEPDPGDDDDDDVTEPVDAFEGDEPGECTDGADNDQDGYFDCDDSQCTASPDCSEPDLPSDDDDATDEPDPPADDDDDVTEPVDAFEGDEPGECTDGADNDQDGHFDCDDSQCTASPDCSEPDLPSDDDDATDEPDPGDDDDDDASDDDDATDPPADDDDSSSDDDDSAVSDDDDSASDDDDSAADDDDSVSGDDDDSASADDDDATDDPDPPADDDDATDEPEPPVEAPSWCPESLGTFAVLTQNSDFEEDEAFEYFPDIDEGWGFETSVLPMRVCSSDPIEPVSGSCYLRLRGTGDNWWMEQLQYIVDVDAMDLDPDDLVNVELSYRATTSFNWLLQMINDGDVEEGLVDGGAWIQEEADSDAWETYVSGPLPFVGSGNELMRIALAFGDLPEGEWLYVDDFRVEVCRIDG